MLQETPIKFRMARPGDMEEILAIDEASFPKSWSKEFLEYKVKFKSFFLLVGTIDEKVVTYIAADLSNKETEIIRLAIAPDMRRHGIAEQICRKFIDNLKKTKLSDKLWLYIRESNIAAIKLCEKLGFEHVATDKGYYYDEDALVMRKIL